MDVPKVFWIPGGEGRFSITEDGHVYSYEKQAWLVPSFTKGYACYCLSLFGGLSRRWRASNLVASTFIGPVPPDKPFCLHKDDDRTNNHYHNLYYGTPLDNARDRSSNGRTSSGVEHAEITKQRQAVSGLTPERRSRASSQRKYSEEQVIAAYKEARATNGSLVPIAKRHAMTYQQLFCILTKTSWAWLTDVVDQECGFVPYVTGSRTEGGLSAKAKRSLPDACVLEIRARFDGSMRSKQELAEEFNITPRYVTQIAVGSSRSGVK